jgi:hypothetical protein
MKGVMRLNPWIMLIAGIFAFTRCTAPDEYDAGRKKIFWGDIHNHCNVGYAKGSLERAYDIAESHLDFYCFTPHSQWHDKPVDSTFDRFTDGFEVTRQQWDKVKRYANEFYRPGDFVSFIGYEWHSSTYGDVCIILPGQDGELVYLEDIRALQKLARQHNALLIPHHPAYRQGWRGQNWSVLGKVDVSPVVEIYSEHGNAESDRAPFRYVRHSMGGRHTLNTVQYLWGQGHQVGIVASTDDHLGYPGAYGEGLAAVYADTLTREAVMEAIRERRTYAVSKDRIELDFRLNGHWMGETLPAVSRREIFVKVKGQDVIDRVEVLRNNSVIHRVHPVDEDTDGSSWQNPVLCRIEFGWGPWDFFNLERVTDWEFEVNITGGKILSATPCFQSGPFDEERRNKITHLDEHQCSFISYTSRKQAYEERATNSIVLEILGSAETALELSLGRPVKMEYSKTLGDLAVSSDIVFTGAFPSESIMIHRLVFHEHYRASFVFTDRHHAENTDWYYVRVTQSNGSLAWSSPVWIEPFKH